MSAPGLLAALVVSAVLYLFATRRAGRWPRRHTAAWLAGLLAVGVALLSRIDTHADHDLHAHMIQHLLLINLAAPLLVAGAPVALALRADGGLRGPLVRTLRSRWAAVLLHPVTAVALFTLVLVGTHVPAVYDAAVAHAGLHALEHLAYVASSMLFWTAVLGVRPLPRRRSPLVRVLMLLLAMPPMALVGVALMSTARPAYTRYALVDQHGAGRLMWVAGTLPMGALVLVLAVGAVTEEERRQQRLDRYAALRAGERPA
jgi:cytochrome c oxidase assembly factor CtaG